ncbi:MAG: hypothetical protein ACRDP3_21200 [Streptomyces sp.]
MTTCVTAAEGGKHGGAPSDKPWTPDPEPPSPDGSGGKVAGA